MAMACTAALLVALFSVFSSDLCRVGWERRDDFCPRAQAKHRKRASRRGCNGVACWTRLTGLSHRVEALAGKDCPVSSEDVQRDVRQALLRAATLSLCTMQAASDPSVLFFAEDVFGPKDQAS